jgi:hypothetical protein
MKHTVIALFDTSEEAQKAAEALRGRGFDASAARAPQGGAADDEVVPPAAEIESGPLTGLLHRLSSLFGVEDTHLAHYEKAVQQGGGVVHVDAEDESQAAAARGALIEMGASDIDDVGGVRIYSRRVE